MSSYYKQIEKVDLDLPRDQSYGIQRELQFTNAASLLSKFCSLSFEDLDPESNRQQDRVQFSL